VIGNTAFLSAGIGPVAAAFGLTHFLEDYRPERIIALGTAGIIDTEHFSVGQAVRALSVATASGFFQLYTPEPQPHRILLSVGRRLVRRAAGLRTPRRRNERREPSRLPLFGRLAATAVYAPQEITREEGFRQALQRQGYGVEHLEGFAYVFTARQFGIPIDLVLGLTNVCGPGAHREWKMHARVVLEKTAKIVAGAVSCPGRL
jgi:nucleoside phosphorylase